MEDRNPVQRRFPGSRGAIWAAASVVVLVGAAGLYAVIHGRLETLRDDHARSLEELSDTRRALAESDVEVQRLELARQALTASSERERVEAQGTLETERLARQTVEDSLRRELEKADQSITRADETLQELRRQLAELKQQNQTDRAAFEQALAAASKNVEQLAADASRQIQLERDARARVESQLSELSKAHAEVLRDANDLAAAEQFARLQAAQEADRRAEAEQAAQLAAQEAQRVGQIAAIEASRRVQAEQAAMIAAQQREQAQRELMRRRDRELDAIDRELIPLKTRLDRDTTDFKRMHERYMATISKLQSTQEDALTAARKSYNADIRAGISQDQAKETRKQREAQAKSAYDTGLAKLVREDKAKLDSLKGQIEKTSDRVTELCRQREAVERKYR